MVAHSGGRVSGGVDCDAGFWGSGTFYRRRSEKGSRSAVRRVIWPCGDGKYLIVPPGPDIREIGYIVARTDMVRGAARTLKRGTPNAPTLFDGWMTPTATAAAAWHLPGH